jgi:hypothetical protein
LLKDIVKLTPTIYELESSSNNIFMTLKMVILTTNTNLNGTRFKEDFIDGIVENQNNYLGIALVVEKDKLEAEQYDSLTHNFDGKTLGTDMIGSFISFEKGETEDGAVSLIGEARVMKRFGKTCSAIVDLFQADRLRFSCEVLIKKYDNVEENYREVSYHGGINSLIGNTVVSEPAEVDAKPTLLVASLNYDLKTEISNGGANMGLSVAEKRKMMNEFASKLAKKIMAKVRADAMLDMAELAEINMDLVDGVIGLMGEDFNANSYCGFWVGEELVFDEYFVAQDYYNGDLYMFDYSVSEEGALSVSSPRKAKFELVEIAEQVLASISKRASEIKAELEAKEVEISSLQTAKGDVELELEVKKTEIANLQTEKEKVDNELATVKDEVQSKDEALSLSESQANERIIALGQVVDGLKDKLQEVEPIVEQYKQVQQELAEKAKSDKQKELVEYALNSKMIDQKEIEEDEEIKLAITELNELKIKGIVADRIVKSNIELSNLQVEEKNEDVVINVNNTKDYIAPSLEEKYGL